MEILAARIVSRALPDCEMSKPQPAPLRGSAVCYVQYGNPAMYPPLEHSAFLLSREGFAITLIGTDAAGGANRIAFDPRLSARMMQWRYRRPGLVQKLQFVAFALNALWRVRRDRPEWVYCSDPLSCFAGRLIKRHTRARLVYHEHDSPSATDERSWVSGHLARARQFVAREADIVILPNEERIREFVRETGRDTPVHCVYNVPRREEVRPPRAGPVGVPIRLLYHGSINRERLPFTVLEAMARFPGRFTLDVVGYETGGSLGYVAAFLDEARRVSVGEAVTYRGTVRSRADMIEIAAERDVGLALMPMQSADVNMVHMAGASNKPFDYLACGLALLVSDLPAWRQMYVDSGYGIACDPRVTDSLAAAMLQLVENSTTVRAMGERGRARIQDDWNYETQFAAIVKAINAPDRRATAR